jgi:hydantoinase/carbamoylase family amidase
LNVIESLRELARLTGDDAGAQRLAWTETWDRARRWLEAACAGLPVEVETDEAGNQWLTLRGRRPEMLVLGGHLDSVAAGGWLDGALNVVAALAVLSRLSAEGTPPVSVAAVSWADEEGARFGRSLFGSSAAAGRLDIAAVGELGDAGGVRLRDAVARYGVDLGRIGASRGRLANVRAYLELHIEQGPVLEARGLPLGAVIGTFGVRRHRVSFRGQAAHAGATPMELRRDALAAAAELVLEVEEAARKEGGVGTVGRLDAEPGAATIVPGATIALVDLRHLEREALERMLEAVRSASEAIAARRRVGVEWADLFACDPAPFDPGLIATCEAAAREVAGECLRLPSGPLHDATSMAQAGIPTAMIFVRSRGGLSHCKEEDSDAFDIDLGVAALELAARRVIGGLS